MLCRFFIALVLLSGAAAHGATYYVGPTGHNSHTCGQARAAATPKLTIAAGLACLSAGDTLVIKAGIYAEFINGNQIPAGGGSWPTATKIIAAPGEAVILRPPTGGAGGDAVWIRRSYIILDGLIIDATNVPVQGIRINGGASYVRIQNSEVKNARNSNCLGIQDASSNFVEIISSKFHHCGSTRLHHGVYLRGSNHLVERSEVFNISGYGVHQWNSHSFPNDRNVIRFNDVHDNGEWGILVGSGDYNIVYQNTVRRNGLRSGKGGISIGHNSPEGNEVYGNTIQENAGECILIGLGSTGSKVYDNVCWRNGNDTVKNLGLRSVIADNHSTDPRFARRGADLSYPSSR